MSVWHYIYCGLIIDFIFPLIKVIQKYDFMNPNELGSPKIDGNNDTISEPNVSIQNINPTMV